MKTYFQFAAVLAVVALVILGIIGWCSNVYKLTQLDFEPSYKAEVIRGISIFVPPLGAIAGYITFAEEESK